MGEYSWIWLVGCRKGHSKWAKIYGVIVEVRGRKRYLKKFFKRKSDGLNYGLAVVIRIKKWKELKDVKQS